MTHVILRLDCGCQIDIDKGAIIRRCENRASVEHLKAFAMAHQKLQTVLERKGVTVEEFKP